VAERLSNSIRHPFHRWWVATALWALLVMPAKADRWPAVPYMPGTRVNVVGENLKYNGAWMNAYEMTSPKSVKELIGFYQREWGGRVTVTPLVGPAAIITQEGLKTNEKREEWQILAHREGDFLITIQLGENPAEAGSLGYVGIMESFDAAKGPYKTSFPMPSRSSLISEIFANDLGRNSRTVTLFNYASIDHNINFYRNYYLRRGWMELGTEVRDRAVSADAGALLMSKGSSEMNLMVGREGLRSLVSVVIVEK